MTATIRSIAFVAALAALSVLQACGGGGGGDTAPPPVATDTTPPSVLSATPANGATGVSMSTPIALTVSEPIRCGPAVTGTFGTITGTLTCTNTTDRALVVVVPSAPLTPLARYTFRFSGYQDPAGNTGQEFVSEFTVAAPPPPVVTTAKLYINLFPEADGSKAVAIVDAAAGTVKQVGFPGVPGFQSFSATVVDSLTGKVYFASKGGYKIYVRDLATDDIRPSIDLDPTLARMDLIWELRITETDICAAMSGSVPEGVSQNRLMCWDRWTNRQTYSGANNTLASADMFTTGLSYVTAPTKQLYAINALTAAWRQFNYPTGTIGTLVKLHPTSYAVEATYTVGSVPKTFRVHEVTGQVWVVNAGDKTISIVNPVSGQVETMGLGFMRTQQRPEDLLLAVAKNRVFVTDGEGKVYAYDLTTRREVAQVLLGAGTAPAKLAVLGNELWVTCVNGTVVAVNLDTLSITRTITVGNSPVGLTSYAPSSSQ